MCDTNNCSYAPAPIQDDFIAERIHPIIIQIESANFARLHQLETELRRTAGESAFSLYQQIDNQTAQEKAEIQRQCFLAGMRFALELAQAQ